LRLVKLRLKTGRSKVTGEKMQPIITALKKATSLKNHRKI